MNELEPAGGVGVDRVEELTVCLVVDWSWEDTMMISRLPAHLCLLLLLF